jgi:parallel beta-helix repeat protein
VLEDTSTAAFAAGDETMITKGSVIWIVLSLTPISILCGVHLLQSYVIVENSTYLQSSHHDLGDSLISGVPHSPIVIDGDVNFNVTAQAEGWLGDGSPEDPYIIDGLDINGFEMCISISNTRVSFTISNCFLNCSTYFDGAGISLYNVSNSLLVSNTVIHSRWGIYLFQSSFNIVSNNNCTNNVRGISLEQSNSNMVTNNTSSNRFVMEAGIWLDNSDSNTLVNNTLMDAFLAGVYFDQSSNNTMANNTCDQTDPHIRIRSGSENNSITWNVFADISSGAIDDGTNNVFDYNYWAGYTGPDADSDGIGDLPYTFFGNNDSYPLQYLPTPPTWDETPSDLSVEFSLSFFQIALNVTCPAPLAWYLNDTLFNIDNHGRISSRSILPIGKYGLTVEVINIYGDKLSSAFSVTVEDTNAPSWLIIPIDQHLEFGVQFVYQVAATDPSGIDLWWLNDTVQFSIDEYGVIRNNTILTPGVYVMNITVQDVFGNSLSAVFSVTVEEATMITEPTTPTENIDPVLTFVFGVGLGAAAVLIIVLVLFKRRS